jgi:hypothetical protein
MNLFKLSYKALLYLFRVSTNLFGLLSNMKANYTINSNNQYQDSEQKPSDDDKEYKLNKKLDMFSQRKTITGIIFR